jgi:serine kinase of HPr protein (carbohydrate metabolism regulator)
MSDPASTLIYATAIAIDGKAVLLRGFSGSGKSDFALRLIDAGAELVADDQCQLQRVEDGILVSCPDTIAGLLELRGVGIVRLPSLPEAPLALIADLVPTNMVERLPTRRTELLLGVWVPAIAISAFEASAAAKLRLTLRAMSGEELPRLLDPDEKIPTNW